MNTIKYKDKEIKYEIIKSKIKNVYIHIKDGKVVVTAPKKVKDEEIKKVVEEKKKLLKKRKSGYMKN